MKSAVFMILASLLLVACSQDGESSNEPALPSIQIREENMSQESVTIPDPSIASDEPPLEFTTDATTSSSHWPDGEERLDVQGAVEVAVIPLNLNNPSERLDFEVKLNTHSVDLSMDLASLATLESDNGLSMEAVSWDAPAGGHHVDGVLSFSTDLDGAALLDNASRLTLIIRDVDASLRAFSWIANE